LLLQFLVIAFVRGKLNMSSDTKNNVFARKYRPQKLQDVVGQDSAVRILTNAFKSNDLYSCFLFGGHLGSGKTTTARILAAMENCEQGPSLEPCGECRTCKEIFNGQSSDIREINAASDNGIDVIRRLEDFVSTPPMYAKVKYVILDEFHRMSRQAADSALKLFEEPPPNVRFVLCTTDVQKLIGTINSRALPLRFVKIPWVVIIEHLKTICKKENIFASEDALKLISRKADGSLRMALRNLQICKLYAGADAEISEDSAQIALGSISDNSYFDLMNCILTKDAMNAIKSVQSIFMGGYDVEQAISGITEYLRTMMVITTCQSTAGLLYLTEEEKKKYIHQVKKMSIELITEILGLLYEVNKGIALNINPQTLLEAFAIKSMFVVAKKEREVKA
jgi:DNA polymerase-3 subunit gamma/tau